MAYWLYAEEEVRHVAAFDGSRSQAPFFEALPASQRNLGATPIRA